jgi:signal transduction histidine kinase
VVTALKRATEQSLANVLEHSGRNEADVLVRAAHGAVRVQVRDHGHGFIREDVPAGRLGATTSITERMRDVGGDAGIDSDPHRGTVVTIWWPR